VKGRCKEKTLQSTKGDFSFNYFYFCGHSFNITFKLIMLKIILILLGTISLALGVLGIFIPGLPTTPFLLLTAFLYMKGSVRLYNWLMRNKFLSKYITNYNRRKGMTKKQKIYSISLMWVMIILSAGFLAHTIVVKIIIVTAGIVGTAVMGFIVPLARNSNG